VEIAEQQIKLRHMYDWQDILPDAIRFTKPFVLNGHMFNRQPSLDGTLPQDIIDDGQAQDILSDTSDEEPESELSVDELTPSEESWKPPAYVNEIEAEEERKRAEADAEYRRLNPLATLPDATKFDEIFILPLYLKPGKHQYMVKYKNTKEPK